MGVVDALGGEYTWLGYLVVGLILFHLILVTFLCFKGFEQSNSDIIRKEK
eukprot:gene319-6733_t